MSRPGMLVTISILILTGAGVAQTSKQESTIGELQKELDDMRSQMVKMQNRIAELEAARGTTSTSRTDDPVQPHSQIRDTFGRPRWARHRTLWILRTARRNIKSHNWGAPSFTPGPLHLLVGFFVGCVLATAALRYLGDWT